MPLRRQRRRSSRRLCILIIDPSAESREAAARQLWEEGYELTATDSMDAACAMVWAGQPHLVLINLSAFPALSLCRLGRCLSLRRNIRVLGLVSQFTTDAPPLTRVVRLPGGDALTFGFQSSHPN
jgi:response regulator RpfG family c-di-GMP phosphodiesterase